MTRNLTILIITLFSSTAFGQNSMRSVDELTIASDPGWTYVQELIDSAKNVVEILPVDSIKSKEALYNTQVTTRSPMEAIIYKTGGILIDNGWIRILGSGSDQLNRSLPEWNKGKGFTEFGQAPSFLLIADDVVGGFFLLNGGGLGADLGKVYYLAPDNLTYESLGISYSDFIYFCLYNNLDEFYKGLRWSNWQTDLTKLKCDEVFSFFPYLWSQEGKDITKVTRKAVPIEEQYLLNMDLRKQLGLDE